ncbi:P-loop NTPase fold protein [Paraburkholderia tropica]|uniref:P-loop NTPase fold protein n=1 Tax=Paraburkholderia tropica TaxID=92647 RepID=UPI002ABDE625|nr:P-loop NTPase fold protein [Paraburkholderia tropica]
MSKNTQIERFLDYYVELKHAPQYAVMIRGSWGSGKTWFVKRQLERLRTKGANELYVSLYGVASVSEIEEEFFRQLHPILASKGMALAGKVAKAFLKGALKIDLGDHGHVSGSASIGIPEIDLPEYLKKTKGMILVFDDVERCTIPISELFGYINYFVEHDGYKAILIANEDEIRDAGSEDDDGSSPSYVRIREKLIGKTFEIEADFDAALHAFVAEVESEVAREQITANVENIRAIYKTSDYKNLRHLRQALLDFARLLDLLEGQHQREFSLASNLLTTFLIYSIEMKSGGLDKNDIEQMSRSVIRGLIRSRVDQTVTASDRFRTRYSTLLPSERLLPDSIWAELMSTGLVERGKFRKAILNSGYFPKEEEAWVRLWNQSKLDDQDFERLIDVLCTEFKSNKFKESGILLHVTGILLAMSDRGLLEEKKRISCSRHALTSIRCGNRVIL